MKAIIQPAYLCKKSS